jgi:DNA-binding Lrp family transcriptional regulator
MGNTSKNSRFTQVYGSGWAILRLLIQECPGAAKLYAYLAENIDSRAGVVITDQSSIADELGVGLRSIQRSVKTLEDKGALLRIPVAGGFSAYALNPEEVWRGFSSAKKKASFYTKLIVPTTGAHGGRVSVAIKLSMERHKVLKARAEKANSSSKVLNIRDFFGFHGNGGSPESEE